MILSENEQAIEKKYLEKTLAIIKKIITEKNKNISGDILEVNDFKQYFWSSISEMDNVEVANNMQMVDSKVNFTNESIRQLSQLKRSLFSPYFGRVDFYSDSGDIRKVYVGINGVSEGLKFYVFDWRSPIGSLFYNYGIGKASYSSPTGKINGEIKLKRQYKIKDGELIRCFDSDINIDDEYLQEILSSSSTDKMKNIVNTIQQEQNVIIRNVTDKLLVVQGIAGSGKTSVALHRIAFLLYKEKNLTSNNILIFSPNNVFSEYISNVLPELGEDNVMQSTFSDFAKNYIKEFKEVESFTDFVERYYKDNLHDKSANKNISIKLSDKIKTYLDNFLLEYKKRILFNSGIKYGERIITKEDLNELIQNRFSKFGLNDKYNRLAEYICTNFNLSEKHYKEQIKRQLVEKTKVSLDLKTIYNMFLESIENTGIEKNRVNKNIISYEDLIPYLYLKFEMLGYPTKQLIKHIVIDEAQDYTNLQFYMLSRIFGNSSFTILGDVNQTINPYYKYNTLEKISDYFSVQSRYIELKKTYRSSEEIIDYSNAILGLSNNTSVRHNNNIPVITKDVSDDGLALNLISDIEAMKKNEIKRCAIITKTDDETLMIYKQLKKHIQDLSIITTNGKTVLSNIIVLPSYLAKGLEFDGVIAYANPQNLYSENDKNLYYVVCTRAQHQLIVYNQKVYKRLRK